MSIGEDRWQRSGELTNASDSTLIVPANVADTASMVATAMSIIKRQPGAGGQEQSSPLAR